MTTIFSPWLDRERAAGREVKVVAHGDIQEAGGIPCNTGRPVDEIVGDVDRRHGADWSNLAEDWCGRDTHA